MSVIRSASISAQRAAASAPEPSETRIGVCASLATGVSQSVFERRVHSVESSQPMRSHCFTMAPASAMFVELPQPKCVQQSLRYQLLVEDELGQLEHSVSQVTIESATILVRNHADVERRIYILWL